VVERVKGEHDVAQASGEFSDLFFNVGEECVGVPASDEHDCVWWNLVEVEEHGCGCSAGVVSDFAWSESEYLVADGCHCRTDVLQLLFAGEWEEEVVVVVVIGEYGPGG